jgi:hypothetical protein
LLALTPALLSAEAFVGQFGVTEGKTVDDGVVFIDGRYIESPYKVTRRGLRLFINDSMIDRPARHTESPVMEGYDNPDALSAAQRQKLFRSLEATRTIYEEYLSQGYGYLFSSQGGHIRLSPYTVAYDLPAIVTLLTSQRKRSEKLIELRPHNWHLYINIEPLVDNFTPSAQLSAKLGSKAQELLRIDEFGTRQASVDSGFVFFNGAYLETPYRMERRGLGVFIGDKMIVRPEQWPAVTEYDGNVDPEMPPEVSSESSIDDNIVREYLGQKSAYLRKHNPAQQREVMGQVFRTLPFIVEARTDEDQPHILHITTTEGRTISHSLIPMPDRGVKFDKASVLQRVEGQFDHFHGALTAGACYFLSSKGGRTRLSTGSAVERLKPAIEILQTGGTPEEKFQRLRDSGLNISENALREMVQGYRPSAQLETRLRATGGEN